MHRPLRLFFDGGCRPNPGPMEIAVVVRGVTHHRTDLGDGSNGDAEWHALLAALEIAKAIGAPDVVLIGDSAHAVDRARRALAAGGGAAAPDTAALLALAAGFSRLHIRWIGRSHNLAGIALDAIRRRV